MKIRTLYIHSLVVVFALASMPSVMAMETAKEWATWAGKGLWNGAKVAGSAAATVYNYADQTASNYINKYETAAQKEARERAEQQANRAQQIMQQEAQKARNIDRVKQSLQILGVGQQDINANQDAISILSDIATLPKANNNQFQGNSVDIVMQGFIEYVVNAIRNGAVQTYSQILGDLNQRILVSRNQVGRSNRVIAENMSDRFNNAFQANNTDANVRQHINQIVAQLKQGLPLLQQPVVDPNTVARPVPQGVDAINLHVGQWMAKHGFKEKGSLAKRLKAHNFPDHFVKYVMENGITQVQFDAFAQAGTWQDWINQGAQPEGIELLKSIAYNRAPTPVVVPTPPTNNGNVPPYQPPVGEVETELAFNLNRIGSSAAEFLDYLRNAGFGDDAIKNIIKNGFSVIESATQYANDIRGNKDATREQIDLVKMLSKLGLVVNHPELRSKLIAIKGIHQLNPHLIARISDCGFDARAVETVQELETQQGLSADQQAALVQVKALQDEWLQDNPLPDPAPQPKDMTAMLKRAELENADALAALLREGGYTEDEARVVVQSGEFDKDQKEALKKKIEVLEKKDNKTDAETATVQKLNKLYKALSPDAGFFTKRNMIIGGSVLGGTAAVLFSIFRIADYVRATGIDSNINALDKLEKHVDEKTITENHYKSLITRLTLLDNKQKKALKVAMDSNDAAAIKKAIAEQKKALKKLKKQGFFTRIWLGIKHDWKRFANYLNGTSAKNKDVDDEDEDESEGSEA